MCVFTFWTGCVCVEVEDPPQQRQLLQDDGEAIDVPLLRSTGRRTVHPEELRGRPQLPYNTPGGSVVQPGPVAQLISHHSHRAKVKSFTGWSHSIKATPTHTSSSNHSREERSAASTLCSHASNE